MIGYITVIEYPYEAGSEQAEYPSVVYADEASANEASAIGLPRRSQGLNPSGDVWPIDLATDPRVVRLIRVMDQIATTGLLSDRDGAKAALAALGSLPPAEWLRILSPDVEILDPDGWRGAHAPSFDTPCGWAEFGARLARCTLRGGNWGKHICHACPATISAENYRAGIRYCYECSEADRADRAGQR